MPVQLPGNDADTERKASPRQIALLQELARERDISVADSTRLVTYLARHTDPRDTYQMSFDKADRSIKWFFRATKVRSGVVPSHIQAMPTAEVVSLRQPDHRESTATRDIRRDPATLPTQGVFRKDGETYVVVPTRSGKHIAKRLVETPERLTSSGETVKFDWVSAPGVIWALYEEHRLPVSDIEAMMIQHRVCIYPGCLRTLKAAKSVTAGVGKRHAERLGIPWGTKRG
ncbi:MAG TPA: hypothetical protein VGR71_11750 [Nitrospira sp.]|nr:hypothetical protein [Nitrospira sp.]